MPHMKLKKICVLIVLFIICITTQVKAVEPEITATSAVVIDCKDGKILYSKNPYH